MIIKRDGRKVEFDRQKIENAILKAFRAVDGTISQYALTKAENIATYIENLMLSKNIDFSVEEVQNLVEHGLMSCKRKDVARAYITYRNERTAAREKKSQLREVMENAWQATNVQNSNANLDEKSFGGRAGTAQEEAQKLIALESYLSEQAAKNHINNRIYTHDLGHYIQGDHNCLTMPLDDLLANGFTVKQQNIRPAGSVGSALQLVAVLFQVQSLCQFGGVAASHLDWTMVPYVRKSFYKHYKDGLKYIENLSNEDIQKETNTNLDITTIDINDDTMYCYSKARQYALDMTDRECHQAAEAMFHNLNSLQSRSGNQLPFSSINHGTCTLTEGRMIIKALLDECIKGGGKFHTTYIFPCSIFQVMRGVNRKPGEPNYDLFRLALESTSKRIYPNYANCDWSGNAGYDKNDPKTYFSTMGCRTSNGLDINAEPGTNPQTKDGRGNICPVTIILPTLAMEALESVFSDPETAGTEEEVIERFFIILDSALTEAKDALIERFNYICSQSPHSADFMYDNKTMLGYDGKTLKSAMMHGTLAVGQLGLAETLQILVGCNHTTDKGMQLAKRIEQLFKDRCAEFKQTYHLNFGVYMTPAEMLCYTAMTKFKTKYGEIPNVSDHKFFTNSMHVPVWEEISAFDKIDIESQLTGYSNAGCITYIELDGAIKNNLDALETLVNYAMDKDIPYFAINIPLDTCLECGYTDELGDTCPECGSRHIQRLRRVTGYLTGNYTETFNEGKQQEVEMRVKHMGGSLI